MTTKIREAMTQKVRMATPDQTIREAARIMIECDAGVLPVGEDDRLIGVITDRDIATRAVAEGKSPETAVREVMSKEVLYCFEDEDVEHVAKNMSDNKVRRLPVLNRKKRLVGIVSIADLALSANASTAGRAVAGISTPGGAHSQRAH
ncbi:MAG TPA: CBS domain-containing protein [Burkholderiales bacterium]|nr:CBS domain-containing protein [Burkholderiales bacterium]